MIELLQTGAFRSSIVWSMLLCGSVANLFYAIAEQDTDLPGQDVLLATVFASRRLGTSEPSRLGCSPDRCQYQGGKLLHFDERTCCENLVKVGADRSSLWAVR